jgi:hypothetical protein
VGMRGGGGVFLIHRQSSNGGEVSSGRSAGSTIRCVSVYANAICAPARRTFPTRRVLQQLPHEELNDPWIHDESELESTTTSEGAILLFSAACEQTYLTPHLHHRHIVCACFLG